MTDNSEWVFLPIDHHAIRDWAEDVCDEGSFSADDKAMALSFVASFAYYSEGYNVAVTFYREAPVDDRKIRDFIDRLVSKDLARVVHRFENEIHETIGLKLGRRVNRHAYRGREVMA